MQSLFSSKEGCGLLARYSSAIVFFLWANPQYRICILDSATVRREEKEFDMTELHFVIPASAVPKPRPQVTRKGGVYYPKRYEAWLGQVRDAILSKHGLSLLLDGPWELEMACYGGSTNRDGDNTLGGVMDALTGILWPSDSFRYLPDTETVWFPVINPRDARTEIKCRLLA